MKPNFWRAFSLIAYRAGALGQSVVVRPQVSLQGYDDIRQKF